MCVIKVKYPGNFLFVYLGCYKCQKYFFSGGMFLLKAPKKHV